MRHSTPQPRIPIGLIAILLAPLLLIVAGALAWLAWQFQQLDPAVAAIVRAAVFLLPIAGLAGYATVGLIAVYNRHARLDIVKADKVIELKRAETQVAPLASSFNYHNSPRIDGVSREDTQLALPAPAVEPAGIPSFAQLLDTGKIGAGKPLLLGYNAATGEAIEGSWKDLYSCGIGGMQGSGKSWAAAFILAQSAAAGARLIICDPHAGDPESLATRIAPLASAFKRPIAQSDRDILASLEEASKTLCQRREGRGAHYDVIIAVDEWSSLLRGKLGETLPGYLLDFAEQGRKFNVNALLSAQSWTVDAAGDVRDRLTSHIVMRTRPDQARYQLGLRAGQLPLDVRFLEDSQGYLLTVRGELVKVVIPHMTAADLERVGSMIPAAATVAGQPFGYSTATARPTPAVITAEYRPQSSRHVAASISATTASGTATEAQRAAALFVAGSSPADVVKELRGVSSREGARYQAALNEVLDLIRAGMKGGN